ncbi:MAG: formylglycine-generating enzyme family protein [Deltaproteobacteria bacterium]|nr:formylglycine-generating enzyme family protein [Deltaproteobacteria bacterium]
MTIKQSLLLLAISFVIPDIGCGGDDKDKDSGDGADAGTTTKAGTEDASKKEATGDKDAADGVIDDSEPKEIVWVSIPAGSFEMGCSPADTSCSDAEKPAHTVTFEEPFEVTQTEITQYQYESVVGQNPSKWPDCRNCPAESVSWYDAKEFCEQIDARLLSEAEWEYAARGGTTTKYYCGDDAECLDDIAWYMNNADGRTHPVGQKQANDFDLYDTLGGVWEWTEDCWHETYDSAPTDGSAWTEEAGGDCTYRTLRGGLYGLGAIGLRVSNREGDRAQSYTAATPGFRCARDETDSEPGATSDAGADAAGE